MVAQSRSSVGTYTPENYELEYETIQIPDNTSEVLQAYSTGRSLSFEHATLMKTVVWDKSLTLINEINLARKSMKAIVLTLPEELDALVAKSTCTTISRKSKSLSKAILK